MLRYMITYHYILYGAYLIVYYICFVIRYLIVDLKVHVGIVQYKGRQGSNMRPP